MALAVLACLLERPMHPYEMSKTMRERAKEDSIRLNYGSLYSVVEQLERRGWIEAQEVVREGRRPERTIYRITEGGRAEAEDWLTELVSTPVKEYPAFEAALSLLGILPPADAIDLLDQRSKRLRIELAGRRAALEDAARQGIPRIFVVEAEYHIALLEAEVVWVEQLVKELRIGDFDGMELWRAYHQGEENSDV